MKKTIAYLIIILLVAYGCLSVLSADKEYAAEKLFYQANRINQKIALNPDVAPPQMLAQVEAKLESIIKGYPKTNVAKVAYLAKAEFYLLHKKYSQALSVVDEIHKVYAQDAGLLSTSQFVRGNIYEKKGDWPSALKEYNQLRESAKDSFLARQMPLYIGDYYRRNGKEEAAQQAYAEAAVFYAKLEQDHRKTPLGYEASGYLVQTYLNMKRYAEAGATIENTLNNYPAEATFGQYYPLVEFIFVKQLKEPQRAVAIFTQIKAQTGNKVFKKILENKIQSLQSSK
jgi:tetratricopeptide (TPR) repeat protein